MRGEVVCGELAAGQELHEGVDVEAVDQAVAVDVGVLDVATAVDAVKDTAYGFAGDFGPCTDGCPGEAPCQ